MKILRYLISNFFPGVVMLTIGLYVLIDLYYHNTSPLNPHHMKPSTFISACVVAFIAAFIIVSCDVSAHRPTTEYALLIDETDSTFVVPDTAEVISDIGLDTNMWGGVNLGLARIMDVSYVPHSSIVLAKGGSRLASNQYARKREVIAFKTKLEALLDSVRHDTPGKPNSSIYRVMANELVRLANSRADRKVLVVCSDLMEHMQSVSFYDRHTFTLLRTDPDAIETMLLAEAALPDLMGIEVRLMHQPKDAKDDAVFQVVSSFYKKLLEQKGATVTISADLGK